MKLKEVKKVLAFSLAVALAVPGNVWAAEPAAEEASVRFLEIMRPEPDMCCQRGIIIY